MSGKIYVHQLFMLNKKNKNKTNKQKKTEEEEKNISDQEPVWFDLILHSYSCAVKFVLGIVNSEDKLNPALVFHS